MNEAKLTRILYVVMTLLVINVCATAYLAFSVVGLSSRIATSSSGTVSIQIPKDKAQALAKSVVDRYNASDVPGLYALFDPLAQVQFPKEKLTEVVAKLQSLAGKVDDFAYSHTESVGKQDGKELFVLHYKARLSGGQMSAGELKLTVFQDGERLGLYGFFLNVAAQ